MARARPTPTPAAPPLAVGDRVVSTVATAVLPAGRAGTVVAVGEPATWGRNESARVHLIAFDAGPAGAPGGRWHYARRELRVVADGCTAPVWRVAPAAAVWYDRSRWRRGVVV